MKIFLCLLQALVKPRDTLFELSLGPNVTLCFGRTRFCLPRIQLTPSAFDQPRHLRSDHGIDAPHIFTHRFEFLQSADDVVFVTTKRVAARFAAIDGVPNQNLALLLPMPIDPAVTLLHDVWVVGNLDVDQAITIILQIDTF